MSTTRRSRRALAATDCSARCAKPAAFCWSEIAPRSRISAAALSANRTKIAPKLCHERRVRNASITAPAYALEPRHRGRCARRGPGADREAISRIAAMDRGLAVVLTAIVGGILALQAPINAGLGRATGSLAAALVSFSIGTLALVVVV